MDKEPNDFENSDDLGVTEQVSPVRRQNSRRSRKSSGRRWAKITLALGAVAATGGVIWFAMRFALDDSRFRIASFRVQGGKYVTPSEIEEKFSADKAKSILLVPLERRRRQIEQIPWVRSATIRRILPNELFVGVRERVPIAFLRRADGLSLVDDQGVILDIPKDASFRFPVVRGLSESEPAETRREKMRLYAALLSDLARGGLQSNIISEVDLEDPQDARMIVSDPSGTVLLHLGNDNFLARYLIYIGRIDEWKRKFPNIQSVDLRYQGQVVINADPQEQVRMLRKNPGPPHARRGSPVAPKSRVNPNQAGL